MYFGYVSKGIFMDEMSIGFNDIISIIIK